MPHSGDTMDGVSFTEFIAKSKKDAESQEALFDVIVSVIEKEVTRNDQKLDGKPSKVTVFHGHRPPNISVKSYLERIKTFGGCSTCCFVLGVLYLERLASSDATYLLNSYNMHRLVLTAVMVATKFVDDFYFSNSYWSKVGGIQIEELNGLELEFLFLSGFSLHVQRAEYDEAVIQLQQRSRDDDSSSVEEKFDMLRINADVTVSSAKPIAALS
eukprot:767180-Hanusia_phi.AAC.2